MSKNKKTLLYFDLYPWGQPGSKLFEITYIIDSGNLIQDVQHKYTEIKHYDDWGMANAEMECIAKSREKIQHRLEFQIRKTGATAYNAKITAEKLLRRYNFDVVR